MFVNQVNNIYRLIECASMKKMHNIQFIRMVDMKNSKYFVSFDKLLRRLSKCSYL